MTTIMSGIKKKNERGVIMKKQKWLTLAILVLFIVSLFPQVFAIGETPQTTLIITNCDTLDGFVAVDPAIELDSVVKSMGTGSIVVNPTGGAAGAFGFKYNMSNEIDMTQYTHIEFDLFIKDATKLKPQASVYAPFRIYDSSNRVVIYAMDFTNMQTGWNHIKIKLSDKTDFDPNADLTKMKSIMFNYLFYEGDTSDDANRRVTEGLTMNIDDMRFTKYEASTATRVITNCDTATGFVAVDPTIELDSTVKAEGSGSMAINPTGGAAGAFGFKYNMESEIDFTQYTNLEFDLFIKDISAIKPQTSVYAPFRVYDSSNRVAIFAMDFTNMQQGWNHVSIKLSNKTDADPNADWTKMKSIMFNYLYYEGDISDDANRRVTLGLIMNFDNIVLTTYETPTLTSVITSCDTDAGFVAVDPTIALDNTIKAQGTGSMAINPTGGAAGAFGFKYNMEAETDITQYEYIEFDLNIRDKSILKLQSSIYAPFRIYDSSNRVVIYAMDFSTMQTGWNHIKIKLSEKTDFDPNADLTKMKSIMFNYLYYEGDTSDDANRRVTEGLIMNFDNIVLTSYAAVETPTPSITEAIATPTPTDTIATPTPTENAQTGDAFPIVVTLLLTASVVVLLVNKKMFIQGR